MFMLFVTMHMVDRGVPLTPPYLDDFATVMDRRSEVEFAQDRISSILSDLGTPEKASKRTSPFQKGEILGRFFNSRTFTVSVPQEKMDRFVSALRRFFDPGPASGRVPMKALLSLCGQAAFIGSVLHPSFNTLMAPIYALMRGAPSRPHRFFHIKLTGDAKRAGRFLLLRIRLFNNKVSINSSITHPLASAVYTDSSGLPMAGWGYASRHHFRAGLFQDDLRQEDIMILELAAVLYAVVDHSRIWSGHRVPLYCDNQVVCGWLHKGRARGEPDRRALANSMLLEIFALGLQYDFILEIHWIKSEDNIMADALSRHDYPRFMSAYRTHRWL